VENAISDRLKFLFSVPFIVRSLTLNSLDVSERFHTSAYRVHTNISKRWWISGIVSVSERSPSLSPWLCRLYICFSKTENFKNTNTKNTVTFVNESKVFLEEIVICSS